MNETAHNAHNVIDSMQHYTVCCNGKLPDEEAASYGSIYVKVMEKSEFNPPEFWSFKPFFT
jgi:hypothetical protein